MPVGRTRSLNARMDTARERLPKTKRRFGGKTFDLSGFARTNKEIQDMARNARARGFNARTVPVLPAVTFRGRKANYALYIA